MNIKELQERITMITNEMIQVKATYAKLEGHLAEAQHWLTEKAAPAVAQLEEMAEGLCEKNSGEKIDVHLEEQN